VILFTTQGRSIPLVDQPGLGGRDRRRGTVTAPVARTAEQIDDGVAEIWRVGKLIANNTVQSHC
jgi:hypothetical protein